MHHAFATQGRDTAIPIWFVTSESWAEIRAGLSAVARAYAETAGFRPKPGRYLALPAADGRIGAVLFGLEDEAKPVNPFLPGSLPGHLPAGTYYFANTPHEARLAALAFALGSYRFARYRKRDEMLAKLVPPEGVDAADLSRIAEGVTLARDLINTPANDMGPAELHEATRLLAEKHDAWIEAVTDDELLLRNFPLIHAVGRAAARPPRLIDMRWGDR